MAGEAEAEVLVALNDAVLTATLNRPAVLNALTGAVHADLRAALKQAAGEPEVRAVVVTGAGRGFCVGQDLTEFSDTPDVGAALRATYHPTVHAIRSLEKPVIAAINGPAAGAGVSLACACDIRIASDAAFFAPGFVNIGLVPDAGGTYFITRLLGQARAFEWMSSGRRISAEEALAWGLVTEVVAADGFEARVAEYAAGLAAMPTKAIGWNKRLFDHATTATLDEQLELEAQLQTAAAQTADFAEGVAAFLEKRAPSFKGA
ncbi:MAG: enoyl-CoA hydratase-related protein [Gaiellaceae bacterium]